MNIRTSWSTRAHRAWSRCAQPDVSSTSEAPADRLVPHAASVEEVLAKLEVRPDCGLSEQAAQERLARDGPNLIDVAAPPTMLSLFARQFMSAIVLLLVVAAGIS